MYDSKSSVVLPVAPPIESKPDNLAHVIN